MIKRSYLKGYKIKFYPIPQNEVINYYQNLFIKIKLSKRQGVK